MRKIGLLLACLIAGQAHAQSLGNLPPNTVVGRLGAGVAGPAQAIPFAALGTAVLASGSSITLSSLGFVAGAGNGINDQSAILGNKNTFWTNVGPAIVYRMNRLMVGGNSTAGSGSPPSPLDWLSSLIPCSSQCGQISSLSTLGIAGFVGGSRTSDAVTVFGGASGGSAGAYLFGYANDTIQNSIALGTGSVVLGAASNKAIALGAQMDVNELAAPGCIPSPASYLCGSGASSIGALITSGGFGATVATQNAGTGVVVASSATKFEKGMIFSSSALDPAQGAGGAGVAIEMYPGQSLRWYDGATVYGEIGATAAAGFTISTSTLNLAPASQLQIDGTPGVSCAAGTVSLTTLVVTKGIVSHC